MRGLMGSVSFSAQLPSNSTVNDPSLLVHALGSMTWISIWMPPTWARLLTATCDSASANLLT
jgi:hypothetical protein